MTIFLEKHLRLALVMRSAPVKSKVVLPNEDASVK
jgi:hypothetical protein